MQLRLYSRRVLVGGILFIWFIKFLLRPYVHGGRVLVFLLGGAPNLIASFVLPFGAYWLYTHPRCFGGRLMRFSFCSDMRLVCSFGFCIALVNEYLQLIPVFGRTFDYFDLLFSAFGTMAAFYGFTILQRRSALMSYDPQ